MKKKTLSIYATASKKEVKNVKELSKGFYVSFNFMVDMLFDEDGIYNYKAGDALGGGFLHELIEHHYPELFDAKKILRKAKRYKKQ